MSSTAPTGVVKEAPTAVSEREAALAAAIPLVGNPSAMTGEIRLPTFSKDPLAALASLSSCYVNLERGCDFHHDERSRQYLYAWRRPAPSWCVGDPNRGRDTRGAEPQAVLRERLGIPAAVYYRGC